VYSTYLGGSDVEIGQGIAVDAAGAAYVTGLTTSADFTAAARPPCNGVGCDPGRLRRRLRDQARPPARALVYSTYLGAVADDHGYGVALDSGGNAYVTGLHRVLRLPNDLRGLPDVSAAAAASPLQPRRRRLRDEARPSGSALVYSTYLGGSGRDQGSASRCPVGNAYVTGVTQSVTSRRPGRLIQALTAAGDAFVTSSTRGLDACLFTYLAAVGRSGASASRWTPPATPM